MRHTKLALAVGALAAAGSLPVWALPPSGVPVANRLDIGGATATDQVLGRLYITSEADGGPCTAGTIDVYTSATDSGATTDARIQTIFGAANKAVLCTANANTDIDGTGIGIFKESIGGSGNGVGPVSNGTSLSFLNIGTGTIAAAGCSVTSVVVPATAATVAFTAHFGCATAQLRPPRAGISDVDPALLSTDANVVANLTALGTVQIVFAPAVTLNLYRQLQAQQGLEACGNDDNGFKDGDSVNDCDEAPNVPSLTLGQIRSLYTGNITNWNLLTDDAGTQLTAGTVFVCRRGNTSGTEATFEAILLNQRCVSGVRAMANPTTGSCTDNGCNWSASFLTDRVFAGTSSTHVRNCLNAHDDAGNRAIGTLSTESLLPAINGAGGVAETNGFRYIGINRANPDLESAVEGNYELWSENTWNTPNDFVYNAVQEAIQSFTQLGFGNLVVVRSLNESLRHATGDGGLLGIPGQPNLPALPPFNEDVVRTTPVNTALRSPLGDANNCNPPITIRRTEGGGVDDENVTGQGGTDYDIP